MSTLFPILNQSIVPFPVLTVASCPAYRFLRRQIRWSCIPIYWLLQWGRLEFGPWVGEEVPSPREELAISRALTGQELSLKRLPDYSACKYLPNSFNLAGNKVKKKKKTSKKTFISQLAILFAVQY